MSFISCHITCALHASLASCFLFAGLCCCCVCGAGSYALLPHNLGPVTLGLPLQMWCSPDFAACLSLVSGWGFASNLQPLAAASLPGA